MYTCLKVPLFVGGVFGGRGRYCVAQAGLKDSGGPSTLASPVTETVSLPHHIS